MSRKPPSLESSNPPPRPKAKASAGIKRLNSLSALTKAPPTSNEHTREYVTELTQEKNDRGACILVVTNVENKLLNAIKHRLKVTDKYYEKIFGFNGPLGTFDNKIRMGYALEIFGDEMLENLNVIKSIRNAFAHSRLPINFDTPEVVSACELLIKPKIRTDVQEQIAAFESGWAQANTSRRKFITISSIIAGNFSIYTQCAARKFVRDHEKYPFMQRLMRPKPLP